jgi:hypothetical protein
MRRQTEPNPPDPKFPRFSERPLPPYRFVNGVTPHPTLDPAGHLYGHTPADCTAEARRFAAGDWRAAPSFCYGVDLYNQAYWWEAHEAWEALWQCFAVGTPHRHALQCLIQVSAAHLQRHAGLHRGVTRLLERARGHLGRVGLQPGERIAGLELEAWWTGAVTPWFENAGGFPFLRPE